MLLELTRLRDGTSVPKQYLRRGISIPGLDLMRVTVNVPDCTHLGAVRPRPGIDAGAVASGPRPDVLVRAKEIRLIVSGLDLLKRPAVRAAGRCNSPVGLVIIQVVDVAAGSEAALHSLVGLAGPGDACAGVGPKAPVER